MTSRVTRRIASFGLLCVAIGWTVARHEWGPAILIGAAAAMSFWAILEWVKKEVSSHV